MESPKRRYRVAPPKKKRKAKVGPADPDAKRRELKDDRDVPVDYPERRDHGGGTD